jgi:uncharacterized membrane protein
MAAFEHVQPASSRMPHFGAAVLGFALGGFFDGILLHQVLQWHHFLSLVRGEAYQDLRVQILADGLFHMAVYVIAAIGLVLLWKRGQQRPSDRALLAWAVLGFSIWQFSDVVLVHWIIGIHRIRVGVPNPLFWDVAWLFAFGVTTLIAGVWLHLNSDGPRSQGGSRMKAGLSACVLLASTATLLPSAGDTVVVMFRPGIVAGDSFAAAAAIDAKILWSDASGGVLVLSVSDASSTWTLYRQGALLVGNTGVAGCLAWSRA